MSIHEKYEKALQLYAETDLTGAEIAKECQVAVAGFRAYLYRYHRWLVLKRYGIKETEVPVKLRPKKGQRPSSHQKYKDAVAACDSLTYIRLNISEIARMFGVSETGLGNFLRLHYSDILERREKERMKRGIGDNKKRGARRHSVEMYDKAVKMYNTTEKTISEVAEDCKVSLGGLSQYMRFYHKAVIRKRSAEREKAKRHNRIGHPSGNGRKHIPEPETVEKYKKALELYKHTSMIVKDIVQQTDVPLEGFRYYLRTWHRDLMLERRGVNIATVDRDCIDLKQTKRYLKSSASKYADAIASLKAGSKSIQQAATNFGLHPETFRMYLKEHEPELAMRYGMMKTADGKYVSKLAAEKYAEAIRLYETTTENLKSIAQKLGLVYNSLGGYVRRNCPEAMERHQALLKNHRKH